jgi:hypothetical protein
MEHCHKAMALRLCMGKVERQVLREGEFEEGILCACARVRACVRERER